MPTDDSAEREPLDPLAALSGRGRTIQSIDDLLDLDLPRQPARPPLPGVFRRRRTSQRRVVLPIVLFLITCLSTFWAGATNWQPAHFFAYGTESTGSLAMLLRVSMVHNWQQGLAYMVSLLVILLSHEMGHFLATVLYRIPASLPFFIPFPITQIGTMGAVIAMDGFRANRREIFDIGLAGPVAGLVLAIPILCYGILHLASPVDAFEMAGAIGTERYHLPLIAQWLVTVLRPDLGSISSVTTGQLNPWFMAGWVGLLITGVNMMPVSQLDGGHVIYGLFGSFGHWIARAFVFVAITYVVFARVHIWTVMLILVILMGVDHPPTADDQVPLGPWRTAIGIISLAIPILCFPVRGLESLALG